MNHIHQLFTYKSIALPLYMTYHHSSNLSLWSLPSQQQVFQTQSQREFLEDQVTSQQCICRHLHSSFQKVPSSFVLYLVFVPYSSWFLFPGTTFLPLLRLASVLRFLPKTQPLSVYPHWSNSTNSVPRLLMGQTQPIIDTSCLGRGDKNIPTNF